MARYIECEVACAEIDKGDLLVGNNAEFAKEIINRTPAADVVPKSEAAREIFEEIKTNLSTHFPQRSFEKNQLVTYTKLKIMLSEIEKKYTEDK